MSYQHLSCKLHVHNTIEQKKSQVSIMRRNGFCNSLATKSPPG
uniref:Uncharacterized protein n=1 Tax=Anopheles atroparvus TaxID=41427 RepID=A0AAG5D3M1_ANOAO